MSTTHTWLVVGVWGGPRDSLRPGAGRLLPTGRPREAGRAPSPSAARPSPVLAASQTQADRRSPTAQASQGAGAGGGGGLGPAEVGSRGRRGLGTDWGGAAPGRSNFSGTRGRLARPGGEPGPEWGFLVRGSEFRFPWAPRQGMWRSSVRCAPESWPASCGVPLSVTERPVCRRACPPTSGAPECLCRG